MCWSKKMYLIFQESQENEFNQIMMFCLKLTPNTITKLATYK